MVGVAIEALFKFRNGHQRLFLLLLLLLLSSQLLRASISFEFFKNINTLIIKVCKHRLEPHQLPPTKAEVPPLKETVSAFLRERYKHTSYIVRSII
jgi:hypothetical protein